MAVSSGWAEEQEAEVRVVLGNHFESDIALALNLQIDAILSKLGVGDEVKARFKDEKVSIGDGG